MGGGSDAPRSSRNVRTILVVLVVALAARLGVFAVNARREEPRFLVPDSHTYIKAAKSLAESGSISDAAGNRSWGRVPGYPLLLAGTFVTGLAAPGRMHGAIVIQCLIGTLVVLVAARSCRSLAGGRSGAVVGWILALEPSAVAYSNRILSEMPYALVLLLALLAFRRHLLLGNGGSLFWLAAAIGVLPLFRPVGLFFPLAVLPVLAWAWWGRKGVLRACALFLLVAFLPATAWSFRNDAALGSLRLHSTGPWAQAIFAHDVEVRAGGAAAPPAGGPLMPWEAGFGADQGLAPEEIAARQSDYFRQAVAAHPAAAVRQWATSAMFLIGVPDTALADVLLDHPAAVPEGSVTGKLRWVAGLGPLAPVVVLGMVVSLGGIAAIPWLTLRWRRWSPPERQVLGFILVTVLYHWGFSAFVAHQGERYRVPIVPFLALLAAAGATRLRDRRPAGAGGPATT